MCTNTHACFFFPPYGGWLTCQLYHQLSQLLGFERQRQMRLRKRTLCFLSFVAISPHSAAQKHMISINSYKANYNIFSLITLICDLSSHLCCGEDVCNGSPS